MDFDYSSFFSFSKAKKSEDQTTIGIEKKIKAVNIKPQNPLDYIISEIPFLVF